MWRSDILLLNFRSTRQILARQLTGNLKVARNCEISDIEASGKCEKLQIPFSKADLLCLIEKEIKEIKILGSRVFREKMPLDQVSLACATREVEKVSGVDLKSKSILIFIEELEKGALRFLRILVFERSEIGAQMQAFAKAVISGALPSLTKLLLYTNRIGDEGMKAFAPAVWAMPILTELWLSGNQIGSDGMEAFSAALGRRALPSLTELNLWENKIGNEGMQAFATAVGSGALPNLEKLYLGGNQIGDAGMQAFSAAIRRGALPNLTQLHITFNPGNAALVEKALADRKVDAKRRRVI